MSFQFNGDLGHDGFLVTLNYFAGLPDPSVLSDANLVILFKSLLKKDSITKEKSLNELIEVFDSAQAPVALKDDLTIISWVQVYAKLATDNSRTVRILAHQTQAKFLQLVGGKSFSKYLKSSIPIWLFGLFDNDRLVATASYKSLLLSFQNDKDKIDKLWILFYEQIVTFIITGIALETSESLSDKRYTKESDSIGKYERVVGGCLNMLNKVIQIESPKKGLTGDIETLLFMDNIWDYLSTSLNSDTLNLALFKSILALLKGLFKEPSLLAQFKDPKGLFKLVSKKFIKNVKLKSKSGPNSNVIYSSIILQLWDILIVLTEFGALSNAKELKIKKSFWQLGGSKSFSRLIEYLKMGPCNLDPAYYSIVGHFFEVLAKNHSHIEDDEFLDFNNVDDLEIIIKTLCKQFQSALAIDYRIKSFECLARVFKIFEETTNDLQSLKPLAKLIIITAFETLAKSKPIASQASKYLAMNSSIALFLEGLLNSYSDILDDFNSSLIKHIETGTSDYPPLTYQNYFKVLATCNNQETFGKLSSQVIDLIVEDDSIKCPEIGFQLVSIGLKESRSVPKDKVVELIEMLPMFVEADFVQPPIDLLSDFLGTGTVPNNEIINDFYLKLSMVDQSSVPKFILLISQHIHLNQTSFPEIEDYVSKLSEKSSLSQDENKIVYQHIDDPIIFANIIKSCSSVEKANEFITNYSRLENKVSLSEYKDDESLKLIIQNGWKSIERPEVQSFFDSIESDIIEESLFKFIVNASFSMDFNPIANYLKSSKIGILRFNELLQQSLQTLDINSLAVSNPLQQNIALVTMPTTSSSELDGSILVIGKFVLELVRISKDRDLVLLGLFISEYINDYLFLKSKAEIKNDEEILNLKTEIIGALHYVFEQTQLEDVLSINSSDSIIEWLSEDMKSGQFNKFYSARVYKHIVDRVFENLTFQAFEDSSINFNQMVNSNPLQLAVFLQCGSKFFNTKSSKFDRIRNYVAAEILGVRRTDQILKEGTKWVSLLINFFNAEEPYEVVPPHRLAMIINQISQWLDSDIAYDEEFISMRVQLAQLFTGLINNVPELLDKFWEMSLRLVNDNLSICESELGRLDLRYFTLKLILLVNKKEVEGIDEVKEELLELVLNKDMIEKDIKINNQPIDLVHSLIQRLFNQVEIPARIANEKINQLYELLATCDFIPLQRIVVSILQKLILVNQQDFVVEYQLSKSKLSEDEENSYLAVLNETLIKNINVYVGDIDSSSPVVSRYLWSWVLIFAHFEDITFSMKAEYINQLKELGVFERLFDYIFDQVDVSDNKLMASLSIETSLQSYDPKSPAGDSLHDEYQVLLLHLYFLSFRFLGSQIQTWYNHIRDRQLKQKIEKFSSASVSPILITKILDEVSNAKASIESKDENLTIKVNKVINEIKSVYLIDEFTMEMVIKIPSIYPLENVNVSGPLRLGVKENQWKAWLLASQRVISLTNGSIMEAVELFNKNVNLHFSGFEECAICYSILHQDLSLPSKTCTTCNNKFHAACLYKWFKSSGSSTCPLCRSPFNFKK
ncbi:uncharacterized protein CANTADRAFT_23344 [Suhomyces tanzawaensis NRRL Y-17324]|uniref:E3 ubiquitin-protein ligase listerin n=1 Tax=Suhomyces tanzawaensis NRRL Y-17324 TaxID=984487 RepID=A0A1E4SCH0_9ASCO|nr:uncharacterized protein CANTADRAFT_23344 [Suhomyces tanzawaensis NRRL Y-17324]ODV77199.1 hypothetical protein CANTADRAFT_23344 [Suhomyces tanzawaensis NRRL Y-17324]